MSCPLPLPAAPAEGEERRVEEEEMVEVFSVLWARSLLLGSVLYLQ